MNILILFSNLLALRILKSILMSSLIMLSGCFDKGDGMQFSEKLAPNQNSSPRLVDSDGDGVFDEKDPFPNDSTEWADYDKDGIGNNTDDDIDGDGISNDLEKEAGSDPFDSVSYPTEDTDGDGIVNVLDEDDDGDGIADVNDGFPLDDTKEKPEITIANQSHDKVSDDRVISIPLEIVGSDDFEIQVSDLIITNGENCDISIESGNTDQPVIKISGCSDTGPKTLDISIPGSIATKGSTSAESVSVASIEIENVPPTLAVSGPNLALVSNATDNTYTVTYTDAELITLSPSDIVLDTTGDASCSVAVSGSDNLTRTVTLSSCAGNGTVSVSLSEATGSDAHGNTTDAHGPSASFNVDNIAPAVSIGAPSLSLANFSDTITFTLSYEETPSSNLLAADISFGGSASAGCSVSGIASAGTNNPVVSVTGCTGEGSVSISVGAGKSSDAAGNTDAGAGPSTTFDIDNTGPSVSIGNPSQSLVNSSDTVTYTLTYEVAPSPDLAIGDISFGGSDPAGCNVSGIAGAGTVNPVVSVTGCTGDGTVSISAASGQSVDLAGNLDLGAGPSNTFTVDNTAPAVSIGSPSVSDVNSSGTVNYPLTYEIAPSSDLTIGDISFGGSATGCSVSGISGAGTTNPVVSVTGCSGNGTVSISVASAQSSDAAGNTDTGAGPSATFNADNTASALAVSAPSAAAFNSGSSVNYTLTYEHAPAALADSDITINGDSTDCVLVLSNETTVNPIVNVSGCTVDGNISITVAAGESMDLAGNPDTGVTSSNVLIDNSIPTVNISTPADLNQTSSDTTSFTVTYTNRNSTPALVAGDISYTATGGVVCSTPVVTNGNTNTATVDVSGCTGDGTVYFTVAAGEITNASATPSLASSSAVINIDNTAPTVTIGAPSVTNVNSGDSASFGLTYSDLPSALVDGDISFSGALAGCSASVTNNNTLTPTVTVSGCTAASGSYTISVAGANATDASGNTDAGAGPSASVTVDNTPPTVTIGAPTNSTINSSGSTQFTLTYEETPTTALVSGDITINGNNSGCSAAITSGSTVNPVVTVSGCTDASGAITISVAGGKSDDTLGNLDIGAGPSDPVTVDNTAPTLSISAALVSDVRNATSTSYTVSYTGADAVTLANGDISLNTTGDATCSHNVTGTGTDPRTVTLSSCTGDGTVGISIAASTASDNAGNTSVSSGPSATFTVDNSAPTYVISGPNNSLVNGSGSSVFNVDYTGADNVTLSAGDINLNTTGGASCSVAFGGTSPNMTVTLSSCTGNGTVGIDLSAGTANDAAGNQAAASADSTVFNVDNSAPTASISAPTNSLINNSGNSVFTVTYTGADSVTLANANISLNTTGGVTCSHNVTGSGTDTRTVTLSSCNGDGTVGISIAASTASDDAGNTAPAPTDSATLTVDNTAPTISISAASVADVRNASSTTYTVTYTGASAVTLANGDISLDTTGDATCSHNVTGSGTDTRTVTLTSCTGDGTVGISIAASTASDALGNNAAAEGPSATFNVDNTAPTLSIGAVPTNGTVNSASSSSFNVTYSGADNVTLAAGDVNLNTTGGASCSVSIGGSAPNMTVILSSCTGNGTVGFDLSSGTANDTAGNQAAASANSNTIAVDNSAPTVLISAPSNSLITSSGSSVFTVTYSGATSISLSNSDVNLNTSGATCGTIVVAGSGNTTRTVTLSNCTGDGTVGIDLAAGTATDLAGNSAAASSNSATFSVDNTAPTISISGPTIANVRNGVSTTYTITYSGANSVTLANGDISLDTTGDATCSHNVTGSGTDPRTVTLSSCTGNGTVKIVIASSTASDTAGNLAIDSDSATFNVDNTAPTISISGPTNANVRNATSSQYTVTYSGASSISLSNANVSLNTTGGASCSRSVSGSGTTTRTVTLSSCTGNGTVGISIASGTASDSAGNTASSAGPSATFNVDNTLPTVSISPPSNTDPLHSDTVTYTLNYEVAPSPALVTGDISIGTSGPTGCNVTGIANAGTTSPVVSISGCSGNGTVNISVSSGNSSDAAGNSDNGAGPSDSFYLYHTPRFVSIWRTTTNNETITLPMGPAMIATIDWGDGSPLEDVMMSSPSHTYATAGDYTVRIVNLGSWFLSGSAHKHKLISVTQLGESSNWDSNSLEGAFKNANNLESFTSGNITLNYSTTMSEMFSGCTSLTSVDFSGVGTASIQYFNNMFYNANQLTSLDLSMFNTPNAREMAGMFHNTTSLTSVDISGMTSMSNLFNLARMFKNTGITGTLDLRNFNNTGGVNQHSEMFRGSSSISVIRMDNWNTHQYNDPLAGGDGAPNFITGTSPSLKLVCKDPDTDTSGNDGSGTVVGQPCDPL